MSPRGRSPGDHPPTIKTVDERSGMKEHTLQLKRKSREWGQDPLISGNISLKVGVVGAHAHMAITWWLMRYVVPTGKDNDIVSAGRTKVIPAEHIAVQRETKARTILLQSLPEIIMADFHHLDDARDIWLAFKARFGVGFGHKGYDRFQKILSQLNQMQAKPDNEDCNMKFLRALPPSWVDLRYDSRGTPAPTHSAFISAASTNSKMSYPKQSHYTTFTSASSSPAASSNIGKLDLEELDIKWQMAMLSLQVIWGMSAGSEEDGYGLERLWIDEVFDPSGPSIFDTTPEDVAEKPLYDRFVKVVGMHAVPPPLTGTFMPPSNNPDLDDTQFTYGSKSNNYFETNSVSNDFVSCDNSDKSSDSETTDFASCVSSVKTSSSNTNEPLGSAPSSVEFKPMSKTDVQQSNSTNDDSSLSFKENVKPPRNLCNKNGINSRSLGKRKFYGSKTCFVCGSKFHLIKDCDFYKKQLELHNKPMWTNVANIPSFVPKAASVPAGSRNRPTSVPAGSRNRPTSVPAGRPFSAGWKNHAARTMTRPTSHYFQHFHRPGYYNQLYMDEGRWGTAVKPSAGCSWRIQRPNMQWGSKNNGGSHQSTWEIPHNNRDLGIEILVVPRRMIGYRRKLDDFNVYYVEELQNFNLFSVSQLCDTKNKVLFTDKECLVLSKEFQLPENRGLEGIIVIQNPQTNGVAERKNRTLIEAAELCLLTLSCLTCFGTEAVPKILTYMQVHKKIQIRSVMNKLCRGTCSETSKTNNSEANATDEKHLSQAVLLPVRNRFLLVECCYYCLVCSDGPTESYTLVFTTVHTDATSLPPGHSLGQVNIFKISFSSGLANSMYSFSEMEDRHNHSDNGTFLLLLYDDDCWSFQSPT
ncbi:hypothetical protein Tco_0318248 [Tanacetum coccineum]